MKLGPNLLIRRVREKLMRKGDQTHGWRSEQNSFAIKLFRLGNIANAQRRREKATHRSYLLGVPVFYFISGSQVGADSLFRLSAERSPDSRIILRTHVRGKAASQHAISSQP